MASVVHPEGATSTQRPRGLARLGGGRMGVAGEFSRQMTFAGVSYPSQAGDDIFVPMYKADLTVASARTYGAAGDERATRVTSDFRPDMLPDADHLRFVGTASWPGLDLGTGALDHGGGLDVFVAKTDHEGTTVLARGIPAPGPGDQTAHAVDADSTSAAVIMGGFVRLLDLRSLSDDPDDGELLPFNNDADRDLSFAVLNS